MAIAHKGKRSHRRSKEVKEEERLWIRLLIALCFTLIIAAFIHFRDVRMDFLEIDSMAKGYVVAQVDLEFPDPDATIVLRQEALRDVGRIYRLSDTEIRQVRHKFENYLIHHPNWRKQVNATFEEMYNALDATCETLQAANITDARTLKKREELGLNTEDYYVAKDIDGERLNALPETFWNQIRDKIVQRYHFPSHPVQFIIDYFKGSRWKVYHDVDASRVFKQAVEKEIPEKYTQVKAGSRIIDQGEKVTHRHVAMLTAMKAALRDSRNLWNIHTIIGSLVYAILIVAISGFYFYLRQPTFIESVRQLFLYLTIIVLALILGKLAELLIIHTSSQWTDFFRYPIIVPFASILLCILLNEEISLYSTFTLTILMGITLAFEHSHFLFINLVTSIIAVVTAKNMKKRKEVFVVCAKIWLTSAFVVVAFNLSNNTLFTPLILIDLSATLINFMFLAILLIGLMPILESVFNVMTDMTLMEYMDPTNDLLKRLAIEAPGTYQHSLSIGHIAEYVANSIGANGLFCRITTLYHDVGKLNTPHYYTENQMLSGGRPFNIHQLLTPIESAYIIKSHIQDGVALARQHKLPQPFIDVIQQHHGTTLIKYFYVKQFEEMGGNTDDIDENAFRYPGPKPQSKESAIIMLADSSEAASRSLDDNSEESIRKLIEKIVSEKINDGQFDDCPLTFHELFTIKEKLVEMIKATHHLRIKYPEMKKDEQEKTEFQPG